VAHHLDLAGVPQSVDAVSLRPGTRVRWLADERDAQLRAREAAGERLRRIGAAMNGRPH
jgi:hypothetical protein